MIPVRLLGLVGSLRRASINRALVAAVGECLPADATLSIYDGLGDLPLFNTDIAPEPEAAARLKAAIAEADGVIVASPEYNYTVTGVMKNAIDWATRPAKTSPLRGKPIGLVSSSQGMSGGMRAQYHLRQIFVYTDSPVMSQPEVLIPRSHERFDDELRLTDPSTRELLTRFGAALVTWVRRFQAA
jgi:chromate reductase, NAD(P)H dehydrogenase (quinone)